MKKLLMLISFIILHVYSYTQTDVQRDNRVNPVLKSALASKSGYFIYGRSNSSKLINIAVLNQSSHTMMWFTCHGRLFDSTKLTDREYEQVTSKQVDPFGLYQNICEEYLADIAVDKDIYRVYGNNKVADSLNPNYHALFASESVQRAKTPLQKLIAIENIRKRVLTQVAYVNCANPFGLQNDTLFATNKELAGAMIKTKDSTIYYNIDPTSAVTKIGLYKNSPEKLYIFNRLSQLIDSVSVLPEKYDLLLKEKTDVFLLYRGWLELQWHGAMDNIMRYIKGIDANDTALYRNANIKDEKSIAKELYGQLHAIEAKINVLISPEAKSIEQAVYDAYKNETSEISYIPLLGIGYDLAQKRGQKEYELTNHLGNVLVTVTDKKLGHSSNDSTVDYYNADVVSAQDYYPFGMLQPGREFNVGKYRYGFNGKENDNEVKGEGNQQDYGMRIYDPRLGRFLSVDPIAKGFPYWTPYQFAGDNPIRYIDLDGAEQYDPQSKPSGIVWLPVAKAPGIVKQTRSIQIGNYELRGIEGENGSVYWIARYHYKEGKYKGMYNDEFIVGPDGVRELARNSEEYHKKAEWATLYGTTEPLSATTIWKGYKENVSNPVNWIIGAGILASSYSGLLRGTLTNAQAREWYLANEAEIPNLINQKLPLEEQAKQAFNLRNQFRKEARELMADRELAEKLNKEEPNMTWDQVVEKYKKQGLSGDDLWNKIIESSQKSRQSVNEQLNVKPKK
jgi:RHS repeat-associated protein